MIPFFLCWGSFLNVLAYRLIRGQSIVTPRSSCPHCKQLIAWYDNIPVISWLLLHGTCRNCKQPISFLYPFIEIFTATVLSLLYNFIPLHYFFGYFIFFSGLIITIRSDIETMLISRFATLFLIPLACMMNSAGLLPMSLQESICGAIFGYLFLFIINGTFKYIRNIDGIGEGDFELLAYIGSFTGIMGCWMSVTLGSLLGSLYGIASLLFLHEDTRTQSVQSLKIPFGPFLAFGALIFVFLQKHIFNYFIL